MTSEFVHNMATFNALLLTKGSAATYPSLTKSLCQGQKWPL